MAKTNNKEMSVSETSTSLNSSEVTEVNSVPLYNKYYTLTDEQRQDFEAQYGFYNGKKIQPYNVAQCIVNHFKVIRIDGMLYIADKDNFIYVNDTKIFEYIIMQLVPAIKLSDIKAVLYDLGRCATVKEVSHYRYVAFNNCVLDIKTLQPVEDFTPEKYIITSKVYANYEPELVLSKVEDVDFVNTFFSTLSCNNDELSRLYLEVLGYCMARTPKFELGFILKGSANNGKSTYLDIITALLHNYCSNVKLAQLSKDRCIADLYNSTANIIDDMQQTGNIDLEKLQSIITGALFTIKLPGGSELKFRPYCTMLIATTYMLRFKNFNKSLIRRFKVIPFPANFDDSRDVDMKENICQPKYLDIIATLAIQAFSKVLADKTFHTSQEVEADTLNYFFDNNSSIAFIMTHPINTLVAKGDYYGDYKLWCMRNDMIEESYEKFCTTVLSFGYLPDRLTFGGIRTNFFKVADFSKSTVEAEYKQYCASVPEGETPMGINAYIISLNSDILKES